MEVMQFQNKNPVHGESDRDQRFVTQLIQQCLQDKGLAARLRHADNPTTEYQSWDLLARYGIDLERDIQRLPFATVAAAIARAKPERNGAVSLGSALAFCYDEGKESGQANAKLRRLLACDELSELCRILRPLLSLIDGKCAQPLDYVRLLRQLRRFSFNSQRVKTQWAQEFYGQSTQVNSEESA